MEREHFLDADAGDHLADGERPVRRHMALVNTDDQSFEDLNPLFLAFLHPLVDPHGVARREVWHLARVFLDLLVEGGRGHCPGMIEDFSFAASAELRVSGYGFRVPETLRFDSGQAPLATRNSKPETYFPCASAIFSAIELSTARGR